MTQNEKTELKVARERIVRLERILLGIEELAEAESTLYERLPAIPGGAAAASLRMIERLAESAR